MISGRNDNRIGITADGLVALRASEDAQRFGVEDPYAAWFVTDEGRALRATAMRIDRVYDAFNLARFRYTTALLRAHGGAFPQVVLLGAGFDCRALWLEELRTRDRRASSKSTRPTSWTRRRACWKRTG